MLKMFVNTGPRIVALEAIKIHDQVCIYILYQYQPIPLHIIMFIHTYVCAHMCTTVLTAIDMCRSVLHAVVCPVLCTLLLTLQAQTSSFQFSV